MNSNNPIIVLKDMQLLDILAFRGDNRDPKEVFEFGMQRRGSTLAYFEKHNQSIMEPTYRGTDMNPLSAVCVTKQFDQAAIFPIGIPYITPPPNNTWIFMVRIHYGYETYKKELELKLPQAFVQELATRDIPSGDIIGAIQCERFWNASISDERDWRNGMHYRLIGDIIWNPKLKNEENTPSKQAEKETFIKLVEQRKNKFIEIPIPIDQEEIALINEGKFSYELREISSHEHNDRIWLVKFVQTLDNTRIDKVTRQKNAIDCLEKCVSLNKLIPPLHRTALMLAAFTDHPLVIEYLINKGVDVDIKDLSGLTALDFAKEQDNQEIISLFENAHTRSRLSSP